MDGGLEEELSDALLRHGKSRRKLSMQPGLPAPGPSARGGGDSFSCRLPPVSPEQTALPETTGLEKHTSVCCKLGLSLSASRTLTQPHTRSLKEHTARQAGAEFIEQLRNSTFKTERGL